MKSCETSAFALAVFILVQRESMLLSPTHFPNCRESECLCFGGRIKEYFLAKRAARTVWVGGRWLCSVGTAKLLEDWRLPCEGVCGSHLFWLRWLCHGGAHAQGQLWGLIVAAALKSHCRGNPSVVWLQVLWWPLLCLLPVGSLLQCLPSDRDFLTAAVAKV